MKLLDQTVDSGVSQLINSDNQWAFELYKKSLAAHWSPFEAKMSTDVKQWQNDEISEDEKLLVKRILGLFSAGESLVSNSIFTVERKFFTDGCVRQYLGKKDFEECYVEGVEVLTSEGWKKIEEVTKDDLVAQYNEGQIEYVHPLKVVSYDHYGDIIYFRTVEGLNLGVTKDHRMLFYNERKKKNEEVLARDFDCNKHELIQMDGESLNILNQIIYTKTSHYAGKTYCISVPSTYFVVRGGSVAVVCGNTLHNATVAICCEAFGLDPKEVAEAYKRISAVKNKTKFLKRSLNSFDKDFNIGSSEGKTQFIKNLYIVYMLMEGTWFFSSFAAILCLGRQNKLPGLYEQIDYTLSDETRHVEFGRTVINQLRQEYPKSWTKQFEKELTNMTEEAVNLEIEFINEAIPNGILGITRESHIQYVKFLADKRLKSVGLETIYNVTNPYTWISETQDSISMENFFESTVRNYQSASALEDDF